MFHARYGLLEVPQKGMNLSELAVSKTFGLAPMFFRQIVGNDQTLFVANLEVKIKR
jgi:hypothetical protein